MIYKCKYCGKEFTKQLSLSAHMTNCQRETKECPYCNKKIYDIYLDKHIEAHNRNKHECLNCGNAIYSNKKFCSRSCAATYNNKVKKLTKKKCLECNNEFHPRNATQIFCCKECKKKWQQNEKEHKYLNGDIKDRKMIKSILDSKYGHKCSICGISEWNSQKLSLIVDHIDGNSENNSPENLRLVCPNCDSLLPTFAGRNRGKGRWYRRMRYSLGLSY